MRRGVKLKQGIGRRGAGEQPRGPVESGVCGVPARECATGHGGIGGLGRANWDKRATTVLCSAKLSAFAVTKTRFPTAIDGFSRLVRGACVSACECLAGRSLGP